MSCLPWISPRAILSPGDTGQSGDICDYHTGCVSGTTRVGSRDAAQYPWSDSPPQRMTWHPSEGKTLLGQPAHGAQGAQPVTQQRGPVNRGGCVLFSKCSASAVSLMHPKVQGSELPTCHARFSPARLGMQQTLQPSARPPRPARPAVPAQVVVEAWRVAGTEGYPCSNPTWPKHPDSPEKVLGSSQNHSRTLQQLPSALRSPSHFPTRRWFWEDQIGWSLALS